MRLLTEYMKQASNVHPTQLDEYLSNKVSSKDYLDSLDSFPTHESFNTIKNFLDDNGFVCIKPAISLDSYDKIAWFSKTTKGKFYVPIQVLVYDKIVFGNGGIIKETNPVFACYLPKVDANGKYLKYLDETTIKYNTYEDFVKEVNEYFNWK